MKSKLSYNTKRRLRKVAAAILSNPRLYCQAQGRRPEKECGTPGCILGWADALFKTKLIEPATSDSISVSDGVDSEFINSLVCDDRNFHIFSRAAGKLGIELIPAFKLWSQSRWPAKFSARLDKVTTKRSIGRIAADRIEHFIATDGAE